MILSLQGKQQHLLAVMRFKLWSKSFVKLVQALGDTASSIPDQHNEVDIAVKQVMNFLVSQCIWKCAVVVCLKMQYTSLLKNADHHLSFQQAIITDPRSPQQIQWKGLTWQESPWCDRDKIRKCCWEKDSNKVVGHRVATNLGFVLKRKKKKRNEGMPASATVSMTTSW